MKLFRSGLIVLAGLVMGLLFLVAGRAEGHPAHGCAAAPKYRTRFVVYDLRNKTATTLFTIRGEWHAPNWAPNDRYIVSDMGGALYRIPISGGDKGKPEMIDANPHVTFTNDHALSPNGRRIAVTGIALPIPAKIRTPSDLRNPLFIMNSDGGDAHQIHLGWVHGWSPNGKYVVYTQWDRTNYDIYRIVRWRVSPCRPWQAGVPGITHLLWFHEVHASRLADFVIAFREGGSCADRLGAFEVTSTLRLQPMLGLGTIYHRGTDFGSLRLLGSLLVFGPDKFPGVRRPAAGIG